MKPQSWLGLIEKAGQIILDKKQELRLALVGLLGRGHLLIEDVPGVGKTTMVQVMAQLMGLHHQRIQFTSDLLPADIIGNSIYDPDKKQFHFYQGPLFGHLILADELNRANPRTQSALLQAMEEGQVSVDRHTHALPNPFFVIATQNPRHQTGTFPLPESQLDRFLISLNLNYASQTSEIKIFQGQDARKQIQDLKPLVSQEELLQVQNHIDQIKISEALGLYISNLLVFSRNNPEKFLPLSTRAGIALAKASRAWAFLEGRNFVLPEDVQAVSASVLGHRLGSSEGVHHGQVQSQEIIHAVAIPR